MDNKDRIFVKKLLLVLLVTLTALALGYLVHPIFGILWVVASGVAAGTTYG